jgi:hypothetical protein
MGGCGGSVGTWRLPPDLRSPEGRLLVVLQRSGYFHSERIEGCNHFGVWPLSQAAQACFGTPAWPADRTVPQMSLEFEVRDADAVGAAAEELRQRGFTLLDDRREEPWGQTVARLQSQEGSIVGISFAPSLHD